IGTKISKSQVYEAFNEQWIDVHVKNISNKLSELRIQTNPKKIKFAFQQYCQDLGFEMFIQGNQVATENDDIKFGNDKILNKLDPTIEIEIKSVSEKADVKMDETTDTSVTKRTNFWKRHFNSGTTSRENENNKNQNMGEKMEKKTNETNTTITKIQDVWEKYFNGDNISKYALRRVGDNKYQFLHKSCQEYYAAQKIIFDIISWKPN
ncbi:hypothetical protein RFI_37375, partial [Reticulomyxa filosa]